MNYLSTENNFLGLESKYSNYRDSKIVILSAPYEHTVSYGGGTKNGPKGILEASQFVEFYDDEFDNEICFENGICTLPELDFANKVDEEALSLIKSNCDKLLSDGKFVITFGGEHTISSAPINSHYEKFPEMSVLQFDAHSDLRDTYENSKWSHACIMARVAEFFPNDKITQVGIRAQCIEERQFIRENGINTFFANELRRGIHSENWAKKIVDTLNDEIYITFDVDYFDPAIMPSTGTPEPDGFLYSETLDVFREIKRQEKSIIGFDVVELAPIEKLHHPDILTARLIYKLINFALA